MSISEDYRGSGRSKGSPSAPSPLLYALIARGTTILARQAACSGNFSEVTEQVLSKIPPEDNKKTYSHLEFYFHYICENRIIYMLITHGDFERSKAFAFLSEIKKRFSIQYGERVYTALPYAMNSDFSSTLTAQMRFFSELPSPSRAAANRSAANNNLGVPAPSSKVTQVQDQVDELKGIMVENIDQITARGERLELLINRTNDLQANAVTFKRTSRNLERSMCMKNAKLGMIIAIVSLLIVYFIVSAACGGLGWSKCV